jgi:hypothetical protein
VFAAVFPLGAVSCKYKNGEKARGGCEAEAPVNSNVWDLEEERFLNVGVFPRFQTRKDKIAFPSTKTQGFQMTANYVFTN